MWITSLYNNHPYMATTVTILFVSTAVGAMPSPTFTSGPFYRWLFDFLHAFTGGLFRVIATHSPSFQPTAGAQPYRPENANGSTAKEIQANLQNGSWKPDFKKGAGK